MSDLQHDEDTFQEQNKETDCVSCGDWVAFGLKCPSCGKRTCRDCIKICDECDEDIGCVQCMHETDEGWACDECMGDRYE